MFFKRIFIFIDIKISSVLVQFFGLTAICQRTAKTYICIRKGNEIKTYNSVVSESRIKRVELRKGDRLFSHWWKIHGDRSRKMCIESRFCRLSYVFDKLKIWIFLPVGFALYPPTLPFRIPVWSATISNCIEFVGRGFALRSRALEIRNMYQSNIQICLRVADTFVCFSDHVIQGNGISCCWFFHRFDD